ncbi:MAG: cytochrome c3 family protein [Gallionella sp.]|nr:cytochrome c3 family protein [Gallionella sp.]
METSIDGRFVALLAGGALMLMSGVAQAGIAGTKHDLSSTSTGPNKYSGTAELCVFCHTPHGSSTAAVVPLWNRTLTVASSYTTYAALGTTTMDGKTAAVGSVSIACLSCHDGLTAMNTMINTPGSGTVPLSGTWTSTFGGVDTATGKIIGAATKIGTDLQNDHPVGVQYGGGGYLASNYTTATGATVAKIGNDKDFYAPNAQNIGGTSAYFWVETGANNTKSKTDLVLYTRNDVVDYTGSGAITGDDQPYVECATCHDPHTANNPTFLRISNAGSALCLSCHDK